MTGGREERLVAGPEKTGNGGPEQLFGGHAGALRHPRRSLGLRIAEAHGEAGHEAIIATRRPAPPNRGRRRRARRSEVRKTPGQAVLSPPAGLVVTR